MSDQTPIPHQAPCYAITSGLATSISTDGTTAMLVFAVDGGGKVALTMPTDGLRALRTMANDAMVASGKRAGNQTFKRPQAFQVGHSDQVRNHVAIWFDPNTQDESVYLVADQDALRLCQSIGHDIGSRNAALAIAKPRLILPGGHA